MSLLSTFTDIVAKPPGPTPCNIVVCCAPDSEYKALPTGQCPDTTCVPKPVTVHCPKIYLPVCGSDNNTYPNKCEAIKATGQPIKYEGKCSIEDNPDPNNCLPSTKCGPGTRCISAKEPVCGVDGKTYWNPSEAGCAGVTIAYAGVCKPASVITVNPGTICGTPSPGFKIGVGPVCGYLNNQWVNFASECEAFEAGVTSYVRGKCGIHDPTIPPSPERPGFPEKPGPEKPVLCTKEYMPVCDVKTGTTYGNKCEAKAAGVTDYIMGKCTSVGPQKPGTGSGPVKPGAPVKPEGPGKPGGPVKPPPGDPNAPKPLDPNKPHLPGQGNGGMFNGGFCGVE